MSSLGPALFAFLHADGLVAPHDIWSAWPDQPLVAIGLLATGTAYVVGVRRLWRTAGTGRSLAWWQVRCFVGGLALVALALLSPLDPLGETLFAAHMVQHLLLMTAGALLLALGAPDRALLWMLSPEDRRALVGWWHRRRGLRATAALLREPAVAWMLSVGTLAFWHLPGPYQAALAHDRVHALEHLSFIGAGLLFWWVAVRQEGPGRLHPGMRVLYVFTAGLPGGLLGALLTFAGRPLYATQSAGAPLWGLTPLEDQQFAGLVMWMPGALFYLSVAGWLFVRWLGTEERREVVRAAATAAAAACALFLAEGCRPDKQVPQGADSLQTAGLPAAPIESLPAGRALAGSGFRPVTAIVGLSAPESARYDSAQDCWFVSNTTGTLTARDNSGFISRIRADGAIDSLRFIAGGRGGVVLNAPSGLDLAGDTLWVADVSAVRAFNARTGAPIRAVDLAPLQPRLLNDLIVGPKGDVYVTDTGVRFGPNGELQHPGPDRVFRIDRNGRPSVALSGGMVEGPNGIAWSPQDRSFLIVSFTGDALYRWRLGSRSATRVARGAGRWDGIEVIDGDRALVTSWADSSLYLWSGDGLRRVLGGLPQPADIGIDTRRRRVAIPVSSENRVELWAIPGPGAGT